MTLSLLLLCWSLLPFLSARDTITAASITGAGRTHEYPTKNHWPLGSNWQLSQIPTMAETKSKTSTDRAEMIVIHKGEHFKSLDPMGPPLNLYVTCLQLLSLNLKWLKSYKENAKGVKENTSYWRQILIWRIAPPMWHTIHLVVMIITYAKFQPLLSKDLKIRAEGKV